MHNQPRASATSKPHRFTDRILMECPLQEPIHSVVRDLTCCPNLRLEQLLQWDGCSGKPAVPAAMRYSWLDREAEQDKAYTVQEALAVPTGPWVHWLPAPVPIPLVYYSPTLPAQHSTALPLLLPQNSGGKAVPENPINGPANTKPEQWNSPT